MINVPIISTKIADLDQSFNLTEPKSRALYFRAKAGKETRIIKKFLQKHQFTAYFLGKKNSGKGTYSKLFAESLGSTKLAHISVGDLVRDVSSKWDEYSKSAKYQKLIKTYRGFINLDEAIDRLLSRTTSKLLPTEFILALLKIHLEDFVDQSIFLDGFPREDDQLAYTLFLKDILGRGSSKDLFILIDIPDTVLDERIKYRVICPICQTPRNLKLLATQKVGFDKNTGEFYLMCDNPSCNNARMVRKEGDDLGVGPIKERLAKDQQILEKVDNLNGLPKILLRNAIPVDSAKNNFDDYEITPQYNYQLEQGRDGVKIVESPWIIKDNQGIDSYSLLPAPVVITLIKQMAKILST